MKRRDFLTTSLSIAVMPIVGVGAAIPRGAASGRPDDEIPKFEKPKAYWKTVLTAPEYVVLFEGATERPYESPLNDEKRKGTFICVACFLPLFESSKKYDSGTGWPSFFDVIQGRVGTKLDFLLVLPRTEYHCIRCGGHQGHVFKDGPRPTGLRYCNNGRALKFVAAGETLPAWRT